MHSIMMCDIDGRSGVTFDVRSVDLRVLNSVTKYPSIPTYHELDPRNGGLLDTCVPFHGTVIGTEKVDGTNSRIILLPDGMWLLGSREELLYARGDLIGNPALGIVEALRPVAAELALGALRTLIQVYYLELYGGKIGGQAKQYTADSTQVGWRLFDVALIDFTEVGGWPAERISRWREEGGQRYLAEAELERTAGDAGLALTPRLFTIDAADLPTDMEGTQAFLDRHLPGSRCLLDESGQGTAEGIVLRTADRSLIAKARFQDYQRTLKRRASQPKAGGGRR
jgi:RNA ligase-like protein